MLIVLDKRTESFKMKMPFCLFLALDIVFRNNSVNADPVNRSPNHQIGNQDINSAESQQDDKSKMMKYEFNADNFPDSFDWRLIGAVTPVRNQTDCGACWAIAAVGSVEGALFVHKGKKNLIRLSEQAVIDCSWDYGNSGCDGGYNFAGFKWIIRNGGIPTDESYGEYKAKKGICHVNDPGVVLEAQNIIGWIRVRNKDPYEMKRALLKYGPIAVSIHATKRFKRYNANSSSEVFYDAKCRNAVNLLSHSVLLVGYGKTKDGKEYWIIKNSHGVDWGHNGYILMVARDNHCGVLTEATYPMFDLKLYRYEKFLIFLKDPYVRRFALAIALAIAACVLWNVFCYIKKKCEQILQEAEAENANEEMIELN